MTEKMVVIFSVRLVREEGAHSERMQAECLEERAGLRERFGNDEEVSLIVVCFAFRAQWKE